MPDRASLDELRMIRMRLDSIEHTQEVLVRADVDKIWPPVETLFRKDPLLAQVYLLLDGECSQRGVVAALGAKGIEIHEATVSRKLATLRDWDLIQLVDSSGVERIYVPTRLEKILRLKKRVERLLLLIEKEDHAARD